MKSPELFLNDANLIAVSANKNGHIKYVSPAVEKISGYKTENLQDDFWWENTYNSKKEGLAFKENVINVLANKATINLKPYERKLHCKDGSYKWIEWRDSIGANNNYVSVGVDISDWKKKEEIRIQSDAILKNIPSIVLVGSQTGEVVFASPSVKKILGYNFEEIRANNWWEKTYVSKYKAEDAKEAILNYVFKDEKSYIDIFKQKIKTKSDVDVWIEWQYSKGANGTFISIGTDITDRIISDFELKKAKEAAEESVQVKNDFLANMSHEIRTPLNAVIGFTDLLLETQLTQEQREHLETMRSSGEILLTLINNVLDLSKLESNKFEIEKIPFNLNRTLNEVVKLMKVKAHEKEVFLNLNISPNVPEEVVGDSNRISQILLNLIGNAIKFTDKGSVTVTIDKIEENNKTAIISFEIKDTGIGIVSNKINSVFGAFTQAKSDTSRIYGGTGLGLTIVKRLITLLNGQIKVESVFGKGSTFTMSLPMEKGSKTSTSNEENEQEIENQTLGYAILLVEDNKTNQLLAKTRLERWGCTVDIANNGFEGVKKTQQKLYDIIMMDIQMPVMDGYEATKIIKNDISVEVSKIPIIAMTAFTSKTEINRALEAGMDDYIFKPFKPNELFSLLKKHGDKQTKIETSKKNLNESNTKNKYIDLDFLEKETLNETTVLVLLIDLFFKDLKEYRQILDKELKLKNWQTLYKATHKIKPSISMFGIAKLEPIIFSLEQKFKEEKNLDKVDDLVKKCKNIIVNVKEELKVELKTLKNE